MAGSGTAPLFVVGKTGLDPGASSLDSSQTPVRLLLWALVP